MLYYQDSHSTLLLFLQEMVIIGFFGKSALKENSTKTTSMQFVYAINSGLHLVDNRLAIISYVIYNIICKYSFC